MFLSPQRSDVSERDPMRIGPAQRPELRPRHTSVRRAAIAGAVLLLGIGTVVIARGSPPSWDTANGIVDAWLAEMAKPSGDRGWSLLSAEAQAIAYEGDAQVYWRDLEGVDWEQVSWAPANGHVDDGAYYLGGVWLRSHPSTLPRFLVERGLATAGCVDGLPYGVNVQMRVGWFNPPRITRSPGGTGSADACRTAFEDDPGAEHAPYDSVGGAWATPGAIQRVGVRDASGLVTAVGPGRENVRLDGEVEVTTFGPRQLAITWRGASCDSNSTLVVEGTSKRLRVRIARGLVNGCSGTDVVYDSILELNTDMPIEDVDVQFESALDDATADPDGLRVGA